MNTVEQVLTECRRALRSCGVARDQRKAMLDELDADIRELVASDGDPRALVGDDVRAFARDWAESRGAVRPRWRLSSTTIAAIVGVVPAVLFAAVLPLIGTSAWAIELLVRVFPGQRAETNLDCAGDAVTTCPSPTWTPSLWLIALWFAVALALGFAGAVFAASTWLRRLDDPAVEQTRRNLLLLMPIGALIFGVPMVWFNQTYPGTTFGDGGWVIAVATGAVLVISGARAWAVAATRRLSSSEPRPLMVG
ncbi:MAG: hypothetical protein RI958_1265 [Actinomycetota bacterium]